VVARVAGLEDIEPSEAERVFARRPLPAAGYDVGPFRLESRRLPHYVPNAGVRLSAPGLVVAYTGDTGPDPALADLGRDADLFIVDATDRHQDAGGRLPGEPPLNLTAREAGEHAAAAGARRLMLTHFWPGNDRDRSRADAAEAFHGEILLADDGAVVELR
jgi:ribonuclease BN (tRNA processing enzyme)